MGSLVCILQHRSFDVDRHTLHCSVALARDVAGSVLSCGFVGWPFWLPCFRSLLIGSVPVDVCPAITEVIPFGGSDLCHCWTNNLID
ncbi:hypothetical protein IFVP195_C1120270 [Vibrio parahaemolyticus]